MKRARILSIIILSFLSAAGQPANPHNDKKDGNTIGEAKLWLIKAIESGLNEPDVKISYKKIKAVLTSQYDSYKNDAMALEYDAPGSPQMTPEKFRKKWSGKYNVRFAGKGGFLISAQDYGKIKVTNCAFIRESAPGTYWFKVKIEDLTYKAVFDRDVKVIKAGPGFLIDDILEYN